MKGVVLFSIEKLSSGSIPIIFIKSPAVFHISQNIDFKLIEAIKMFHEAVY